MFTQAQADIVISGGSELFQMCVAVFGVDTLRPFLRDEVKRWAEEHYENMKKDDILAALPADVRTEVQGTRKREELLKEAAESSFEWDQTDDRRRVVELYAGVARLVYKKETEVVNKENVKPEAQTVGR